MGMQGNPQAILQCQPSIGDPTSTHDHPSAIWYQPTICHVCGNAKDASNEKIKM